MITPFFKVDQTPNHLLITIRAPNANLRDAEIDFFDQTFLFSAHPYFLRLHFSASLGSAEKSSNDYDADSGCFKVQVPKQSAGEHFEGLDMLSELLKPQRPSGTKAVEELDDNEPEGLIHEQVIASESEHVDDEHVKKFGYGFAWTRTNVLSKFGEELDEIFEMRDADNVAIEDRAGLLAKKDEKAFDSEHFLADLFDPTPELESILKEKFPEHLMDLDDADRDYLKDLIIVKLPRLGDQSNLEVACSLLDIVYAYLFDLRITEWEHNVVSDLMIGKMSPSLSGLARFGTPKCSLKAVIRRALCYPLYRNWDLCKTVLEDLETVVEKGRSSLLHCLLRLRKRFYNSGHEFVYLYNQLFIDDYCLWIQSVPETVFVQLQQQVKDVTTTFEMSDIADLDLEYIVAEAKMIMLKVNDGEYDSDDN